MESDYDAPDKYPRRLDGEGEFVGRDFGLQVCARGGGANEDINAYTAAALSSGARERSDLLWCRSMMHWDLALAYLTYGKRSFSPISPLETRCLA